MKKLRIALLVFAAFDFLFLGNAAGLLPLTPLAAAQNRPQYPFVSGAPDCLLVPSAPFTAIGDSLVYDNRNQGCTTWHLVYSNQGFSALNISFKSADDSGNGPGAFTNWGTSGGTLASGTTLPLTATTSGQATGYKYRPFVKISVTSATGTGAIWPILYGYRPGISDSNTIGVTTAQGFAPVATALASAGNPFLMGCIGSDTTTQGAGQINYVKCSTQGELSTGKTLTGADGSANTNGAGLVSANGSALYLQIWPYLFNGATWDRQITCPNTDKVNALGAATVALVAPVAGKKVRICSFTVSNNNATATTLKIVEGTGATCGTGTADLTSLFNIGASTTAPVSMPVGPQNPWTTKTVADGACATSSAASALEITYTWEQH